jgi:hypothetical protein
MKSFSKWLQIREANMDRFVDPNTSDKSIGHKNTVDFRHGALEPDAELKNIIDLTYQFSESPKDSVLWRSLVHAIVNYDDPLRALETIKSSNHLSPEMVQQLKLSIPSLQKSQFYPSWELGNKNIKGFRTPQDVDDEDEFEVNSSRPRGRR